MRYIVEYKKHDKQTPYFIDDGGYFQTGHKFLGVTKDSTECHVPVNTLITFTNAEFITKLEGLTIYGRGEVLLTTEEKTALANAFLSDKGFS